MWWGLGQWTAGWEKEEQVPAQITSVEARESWPIRGTCHMPDDESRSKRVQKWEKLVRSLSGSCVSCLSYF